MKIFEPFISVTPQGFPLLSSRASRCYDNLTQKRPSPPIGGFRTHFLFPSAYAQAKLGDALGNKKSPGFRLGFFVTPQGFEPRTS